MKKLIIALVVMLSGGVPMVALPAVVHADAKASICQGVNFTNGVNDPNCAGDTNLDGSSAVGNIVKQVINILSIAVGVVSVIMIIIGGFKYITSAGDSSKVSSAKDTILYAIIGLVVVALAQVIVNFVISKV